MSEERKSGIKPLFLKKLADRHMGPNALSIIKI
jgi:hypothetical protein